MKKEKLQFYSVIGVHFVILLLFFYKVFFFIKQFFIQLFKEINILKLALKKGTN